MAVYKDKKRGTWYVSLYYTDWTGKQQRKLKRGFSTKKEAQDWERHFSLEKASSLDMWIFLCGNTASPADGEPSVRTSGNRSCEFTRVMFCLSHIPHASKCHVQHQCL